MSNFEFLKSYSRKVARAGADAEKILYVSPEACTNVLRTIAESIATGTVKQLNLHPATNDRGESSFHDHLIAIRNSNAASKVIMDKFFDIKNGGNDSAHNFDGALEDAKELLRYTYDIAAWFMRKIKHSSSPIPPFVMPEPPVSSAGESTVSSQLLGWRKFLGTRTGKWVAGILVALGITFGGLIAMDEDHRWNVALLKTVRIAVFVFVLALLAIPVFIFVNGLSIWESYHLFVSSIADKLGWSEYLIHALGLALLMPFCYAARLTFSRAGRRRAAGFATLILMAIGYNLMFYYATRDTPFFPTGQGAKYYDRADDGIVFYDRAGYSPITGRPLHQVTFDVWREYTIERKLGDAPVAAVDPAANDWFNPNSGAPVLWYSHLPNGELQFYKRPGTNPKTGAPLQPVTHDLYLSWYDARQPKVPKPVTQEDTLRALLRPATSGGPAVLLLDAAGGNGASALERHLSGVNTSAFPAGTLERRGLASRLYQGDSGLVREALAITRLSSLVVADVKVECAKKSSLDADLLSCSLTANARKFNAQGNQAGSQLVQATGAGFNQDAALEAAAERVSGGLNAFARQ